MNVPPRSGHPVLDPETLIRWLDLFTLRFGASPKVGIFTRDISTATGSQTITGVGERPRGVFFFASINGTPQMSFGFDNVISHFMVGDDSPNSVGTYFIQSTQSIGLSQAAGSLAVGHLTSMGEDGFTILWTKTGTPTGTAIIGYLVI